MVNYTGSKSIGDTPATIGITGLAQGSYSPVPWYMSGRYQFDRGLSEFDHRHRFVASYAHDVPRFARSSIFVRTARDDWQLSGILTVQTGGPHTQLAGKDKCQTGIYSDHANHLGGEMYGSKPAPRILPSASWL